MKIIKTLSNCYNKLSDFGKLLMLIILLLITVVIFKKIIPVKEGMVTTDTTFSFFEGNELYDDFYANIYDHLVYNNIKNSYEVGIIINSSTPNETSIIADIGCGTGHHVAELSSKNLNVIGIDISPSMIEKAKTTNTSDASKFRVGDGLDNYLFTYNSLTHILCLYFTIYYMKDKMKFF